MATKSKSGKTAGQHLDAAIATTKRVAGVTSKRVAKHTAKLARSAHAKVKQDAQLRKGLFIGGGVLLLFLLVILLWPSGGEHATMEQAQDIARMLAADKVPIRGVTVEGDDYVITYAAEDAVGRFDDAILYDWGMIYGTAAAHDCRHVSIITTLAGEPLHEQTVGCDVIRQFVRGVLSEEEFWLLVEHKSLA